MFLFLSEAALTGVIGSIFGTILGVIISFFLGGSVPSFSFRGPGSRSSSSSLYGTYTPIFSPQLIIFSLIFPILIAVVAGLYPAWRASRMNAVAALKYE